MLYLTLFSKIPDFIQLDIFIRTVGNYNTSFIEKLRPFSLKDREIAEQS
jgi:hypothetical protein